MTIAPHPDGLYRLFSWEHSYFSGKTRAYLRYKAALGDLRYEDVLATQELIMGVLMPATETGEGVLRVGGSTVAYYRTTGGSFGFQLGAQAKSIVIAFMTRESLDKFRNSSGWKVGVDGSVALIDVGAGKTIDTDNVRDPVVGFIFGSKGLMYNLTLEGSKFSKLDKS